LGCGVSIVCAFSAASKVRPRANSTEARARARRRGAPLLPTPPVAARAPPPPTPRQVIGCLGYWALGSGAPQLLGDDRDRRLPGLQAAAMMAALLQQLASGQLYLLPPLHAVEGWLAARCASRRGCLGWLVLPPAPAAAAGGAGSGGGGGPPGGGRAGSVAASALRVLSVAMSGPPPALALSPAPSVAGGRRHHGSFLVRRLIDTSDWAADGDLSVGRAFSLAMQGSAPLGPDADAAAAPASGGGAAASGGGAAAADPEAGAGAGAPAAPAERPHPSALLMLLVRGGVIAVAVFVAIAAPFIGSFIGLLGGLGYGPVSYPLFTVLYLLARGPAVPRWERGLAWAFTGLAAAACAAATVGSVYSLAVNIRSFHFLQQAAA
jgi:hypothetical protein